MENIYNLLLEQSNSRVFLIIPKSNELKWEVRNYMVWISEKVRSYFRNYFKVTRYAETLNFELCYLKHFTKKIKPWNYEVILLPSRIPKLYMSFKCSKKVEVFESELRTQEHNINGQTLFLALNATGKLFQTFFFGKLNKVFFLP